MISRLSGRPRLSPGLLQLCCTSPLRLSSQPLTPVLSLESDPQILSLTPHLVPSHWGGHEEKHLRLGSACWCWSLCWILSFLPSVHLLLHSLLRFWSSPYPCPWGSFQVCRNFSSFAAPRCPQGADSILIPLSVFFFFFLFLLPYSVMWRLACLFEVWGFPPAFSRYSVGVVPHADVFLMYLWGERWSPHLTPSPS